MYIGPEYDVENPDIYFGNSKGLKMYSRINEKILVIGSIFSLVLVACNIVPMELETQTSANLVKNSSFEEYNSDSMQPEYWQFRQRAVNASGCVEEKCIRSGDHGLLIHMPTVTDKRASARYIQIVQVKPDTEYTLSGWMKNFEYVLTNGSAGCYISVQSRNGQKEILRMGQRVAQGSRWKKFTKTFKTDPETKNVMICCVVNGVSGDTFFDDISLTESNSYNN